MLNQKQKAAAAFIVTLITSGITALLTALQAVGENATLAELSTSAWLTIILAVLTSTGLTTGAVYGTRNKNRIPRSTDSSKRH